MDTCVERDGTGEDGIAVRKQRCSGSRVGAVIVADPPVRCSGMSQAVSVRSFGTQVAREGSQTPVALLQVLSVKADSGDGMRW